MSRSDARARTRSYLEGQEAALEENAGRVEGFWEAGWRPELQWCRLRVLVSQLELEHLDAATMTSHIAHVKARSAALSRRLFGRTLGLAVVVADAVDLDLGELARYTVMQRGFVCPVVVDLRASEVQTTGIAVRGSGFQPVRQQVLQDLLQSSVIVQPA